MSENKNPEPSQGEKGDRGGSSRRKYFRRRRARGSDGEDAAPPPALETPPRSKDAGAERSDQPARRRRRRSRSHRKGEVESTPARSEEEAMDLNYVPPESVFIYTHILRADTRDTPYEYRPEHFSSVSRRLEDFNIDLSPLFREDKRVSLTGIGGLDLSSGDWDDLDDEGDYDDDDQDSQDSQESTDSTDSQESSDLEDE